MLLQWKLLDGANRHDAGIALLAEMYRQQTGESLPEIAVTDRGKPYFPGKNLCFSISHTEKRVFCCLHSENVGIDAEESDRILPAGLAEKWLSFSERQRLAVIKDQNTALLRLWVLKESYAKLTGRGLGSYLKETDFDPLDPRIQVIDGCFVAVITHS
jgi:4'-phosphopantetheinyl transferase